MFNFNFKNYNSTHANSTQVVSTLKNASLVRFNVNKTLSGSVDIYDNDTTDVTKAQKIASLPAAFSLGNLELMVNCKKGIVVVFGSGFSGDVTVVYV